MVDIKKGNKELFREILKKILSPSLVLVIFLILHNFYKTNIHFYLSKRGSFSLNECFIIANIILIGIIFHKAVVAFFLGYKGKIPSNGLSALNKEFVPVISYGCKLLIKIFVFLGIISVFEIRSAYLINVVTVVLVTAVLLFKDNLLNIIAGFMIFIDKPFVVGDMIEIYSGEIVEVLEVGIRRSKFLSEKNAIVNMPNQLLSKIKIVNYRS
ncbi:MAG: mechanosensitive ion channel [Candidatus Omnitrophica bacterium]|nr:mechanosensitive ion channel [Candidatus Omnitrophota bacterium]